MFDFSKVFDFIPNTVQAFASFVPTKDNHRFNIICDIIGLMIAVCYSVLVLYGLQAAKLEGYQLTLALFERLDVAWITLFLFAAICWATTLFKK